MTTCRGSACKTASELHAKVRLGHDPAAEKAEGRARVVETFGAVLVAYLYQSSDRVTDDCPFTAGDRHDFPRLVDQRVPGVATVIDDIVKVFKDAI